MIPEDLLRLRIHTAGTPSSGSGPCDGSFRYASGPAPCGRRPGGTSPQSRDDLRKPSGLLSARSPLRSVNSLLALALFACLAAGCATLDPAAASAPRLSDAVAQSAKASEEEDEDGPRKKKKRAELDAEAAESGDALIVLADVLSGGSGGGISFGAAVETAGDGPALTRYHFGLVGGSLYESSGAFERVVVTGLEFGAALREDERARVNAQLLYLDPELRSGRGLAAGLGGVSEWALDLSSRYYLTAPHTFAGIYVLGGYRLGALLWDYRTPVQAIDSSGWDVVIERDSMATHTVFGGIGFTPIQLEHLHVGVSFRYGYKVYSGDTSLGFQNDIFPNTDFTTMHFELAFVI